MHLFAALAVAAAEIGDEGQEWVTLIGVRETSEWRPKQTGWLTANVVSHDSIDNNRLRAVPESGIQSVRATPTQLTCWAATSFKMLTFTWSL